MARRHAEKSAAQRAARGVAVGEASAPAKGVVPAKGAALPSRTDGLEGRLQALEKELEFWRSEAQSLKTRVTQLEEGQMQACNRLSWAIDAVQSILEGKG